MTCLCVCVLAYSCLRFVYTAMVATKRHFCNRELPCMNPQAAIYVCYCLQEGKMPRKPIWLQVIFHGKHIWFLLCMINDIFMNRRCRRS